MERLTETSFKRLEEARARSEELATELSKPSTFEDARRAAELSREHSELAGVVSNFERYTALASRLEEAEELLRDGADEEMRALTQEEIAAVEPQRADVVGSLQDLSRPRDPNDVR